MSINSAMQAGVSGLVANSSALAAISDNIANVNTVAYKRTQVDFSTMVTASSRGGRYSAGGVTGADHRFINQQGLIQGSSSSTDMAISGDGFFLVSGQPGSIGAGNGAMYTRAGAFTVSPDGTLVNNAGLYLQGWPVKADGTFDVSSSDPTKLSSINVKNLGAAVQPSTNVTVNANLDKTGPISADEGAYSATTVDSMADYADDPTTGTKPDFTVEMSVVDSQGASHKMEVAFLKSSANPNEWHAEIYAVPAGDVTGGGRPGQLASGLVKFDQTGAIDLTTSTLFGAAGSPAVLDLAASGDTATPRWDDAQGVAAQTVTLKLGALTQYASASTVNSVTSDGAGVGNVIGVQVGTDGIISAIFDNSQVRKIAKVAVATFPNSDGLQAVNGNAYLATVAAGDMSIKEAGLGGAGKISPSSLESSTVDLSSEFTGLITTQRAYSASSKIITTADQMLQELINIIR